MEFGSGRASPSRMRLRGPKQTKTWLHGAKAGMGTDMEFRYRRPAAGATGLYMIHLLRSFSVSEG